MKALILATGYLRLDGIHVRCVPEFADVTIEDNVRTAIKLVVEPEHTPTSSETVDVTTAMKQVVELTQLPSTSQ
jgi:hypothetical protein